jgi:hypothetical protein
MKQRVAGFVVGVVLAVVPAVTGPFPMATVAQAKSCSSGYTHAVLPNGSHKCLRVGQFCSRKKSWQGVYHHHGFHCKKNRHPRYS